MVLLDNLLEIAMKSLTAKEICNSCKAYYTNRKDTPYHSTIHQNITVATAIELQSYMMENMSIITSDLDINSNEFQVMISYLPHIMAFHDAIFSKNKEEMPYNESKSFELFLNYITKENILTSQEIQLFKGMILHTKVQFIDGTVVNPFYNGTAIQQLGQFLTEFCDKLSTVKNNFTGKDVNLDTPFKMNFLIQLESFLTYNNINNPKNFYEDLLFDDNQLLIFANKSIESFDNYVQKSIVNNMNQRFNQSILSTSIPISNLFVSAVKEHIDCSNVLKSNFYRPENKVLNSAIKDLMLMTLNEI